MSYTASSERPAQTTYSNIDAESSPIPITINQNITNNSNDSFFSGVGKQGTYLSFLLLIIGIIASLILRTYAPHHINLTSWDNGCSSDYYNSCKSNSAVLRISFVLSIIYCLQLVGTGIVTKFYDWFWFIKYILFIGICIGFYFIDSSVFGLHGYAWFARITGFFYLILLQIILIDVAYTWNERWVAFSVEEGEEKGKKWLIGILIISTLLFMGSIACIAIMFWQFTDENHCADNKVILSLTISLPTIATIIQIFFTDEGSILTSAIMATYATYICFSAISLNPNSNCNPTIDSNAKAITTVIGLVLLVISISWATLNTVRKIPVELSSGNTVDLLSLATGGSNTSPTSGNKASNNNNIATTMINNDPYSANGLKPLFMQVSLVFILVSGYYAMVLTNWATEESGGSVNSPRTGIAAMWIQATGQWIAILFYLWSLVAPKLLPNRDFGA